MFSWEGVLWSNTASANCWLSGTITNYFGVLKKIIPHCVVVSHTYDVCGWFFFFSKELILRGKIYIQFESIWEHLSLSTKILLSRSKVVFCTIVARIEAESLQAYSLQEHVGAVLMQSGKMVGKCNALNIRYFNYSLLSVLIIRASFFEWVRILAQCSRNAKIKTTEAVEAKVPAHGMGSMDGKEQGK